MTPVIDPDEELVWGGMDVGAGPPHPNGADNPCGEPWQYVELTDGSNTVLARVWVGTLNDKVIADFEFDLALRGDVDEAVFPLLVDGFFTDHTMSYYRYPAFRDVDFTNLRTGASFAISWESMDEAIADMKQHPQYVPRRMR